MELSNYMAFNFLSCLPGSAGCRAGLTKLKKHPCFLKCLKSLYMILG